MPLATHLGRLSDRSSNLLVWCLTNPLHISNVIPAKRTTAGTSRNPGNIRSSGFPLAREYSLSFAITLDDESDGAVMSSLCAVGTRSAFVIWCS